MKFTLGTDISTYQASAGITPRRYFNAQQAADRGIKFCFMRASIGILKDDAVEVHQDNFAKAGIPRGFYHFAKYFTNSALGWSRQADEFIKIVKPYNPELPPALDLECTPVNGQNIGMSWIYNWLNKVADAFGVAPIIYTNPTWWDSVGKSNEAVSEWALKFPLWIANYFAKGILPYPVRGIPDIVLNTTTMPNLPGLWKRTKTPWTFWQYSIAGEGEYYGGKYFTPVTSALDLDVFNGTEQQFRERFNLDKPAEPPEPPVVIEPGEEVYVVTEKDYLFGRSTPEYGIRYNHRAVLPPGTRVQRISGETVVSGGVPYIKVRIIDPQPFTEVWVSSNAAYLRKE